MQWADAVPHPPARMLRHFAGLWLLFFMSWAGWRASTGRADVWALALAVVAVSVGVVGLLWPPAVRWIYTAWMMAAFPIGWLISRLLLSVLFYGLFTPIAVIFRLWGRDALGRKHQQGISNWHDKSAPSSLDQYLRQF